MTESARLKADLTRLYALVDSLRRKITDNFTRLTQDITDLTDVVNNLDLSGGGGGGPPYDGADIIAGTIPTAAYALLSVTTGILADLAVTTGKIDDLAVTTGKLAALAVTTAKLADLAVTTGKLADLAVTTAKINDLAVTTAKLAAGAVTWAKLDAAVDRIYPVEFNPGYTTGTTDVLQGVVWLEAGTASQISVQMGCVNVADTATLYLYRQSTNGLLHTFTVTGALADATTTAFSIPASENYEFRGHNSVADRVAAFKSASIKARP